MLPISIAVPWGLNIGDMFSHWPLPAKISLRVLDPIDIKKEFGRNPDHDEVYEEVLGRMQRTLDGLQSKRRLPLIG